MPQYKITQEQRRQFFEMVKIGNRMGGEVSGRNQEHLLLTLNAGRFFGRMSYDELEPDSRGGRPGIPDGRYFVELEVIGRDEQKLELIMSEKKVKSGRRPAVALHRLRRRRTAANRG